MATNERPFIPRGAVESDVCFPGAPKMIKPWRGAISAGLKLHYLALTGLDRFGVSDLLGRCPRLYYPRLSGALSALGAPKSRWLPAN